MLFDGVGHYDLLLPSADAAGTEPVVVTVDEVQALRPPAIVRATSKFILQPFAVLASRWFASKIRNRLEHDVRAERPHVCIAVVGNVRVVSFRATSHLLIADICIL